MRDGGRRQEGLKKIVKPVGMNGDPMRMGQGEEEEVREKGGGRRGVREGWWEEGMGWRSKRPAQ